MGYSAPLLLALVLALAGPAAGFLPQPAPLGLRHTGCVAGGAQRIAVEGWSCGRPTAPCSGLRSCRAGTTTLDMSNSEAVELTDSEPRRPLIGVFSRCLRMVNGWLPVGSLRSLRVHNRLSRHEKRLLGSRRLYKWTREQRDKMWGNALANTRDAVVIEAEEQRQREMQMMQLRSMAFLNTKKRLTEVNLINAPPAASSVDAGALLENSRRAQAFLDKKLEGVPDVVSEGYEPPKAPEQKPQKASEKAQEVQAVAQE